MNRREFIQLATVAPLVASASNLPVAPKTAEHLKCALNAVSPIDLGKRLITARITRNYIRLEPFILVCNPDNQTHLACWLEYSGAPGIHDCYIADADPHQTLAEYLSLPGLSLWIDG